ncbi:MAG TPA: TrmH family RNA methyltransferase [Ornithinibacter sp.]|nr:TrmH family RNA methyltransferase [Ornithinibacter sp.]
MSGAGAAPPPERPPGEVGVGPWEGEWPDGDHWDPELLRDGDRRNVADRYRYWRMDAVVADLDTRRHPFHVAIENWGHDFNIGSVVRTANAFNAAAFHVVGKRRWNRRGAMVTDRYQHEHHHPTAADLAAWASRATRGTAGGMGGPGRPGAREGSGPRPGGTGIPLVGIDNVAGSVALETYDLPRECVLVLGQEGPGLTPEMLAVCPIVLHIEQFGSTRSLNAGAAAAIAMHAWVRRHVFDQHPGSSSV